MKRFWITVLAVVLVGVLAPASLAAGTTAGESPDLLGRVPLPPGILYAISGVTPIPDHSPAGASVDKVITDEWSDAAITDLDLSVYIAHTWVGDLTMTLTHVDTGTSIVVIDRPGVPASGTGCNGDDIEVTLDDEAPSPVENECSNLPAIEGEHTPESPLSAFDGERLGGTWRVTVVDGYEGDTGSLQLVLFSFSFDGCSEKPVTLGGTPGADTLVGTPGPDVIAGWGGNDTINGLGGDDTICGGPGNDILTGGPGNDKLDGEAGRDTAAYAGAASPVFADLTARTANGGAGADTLTRIEHLTGSPFGDILAGSRGANTIRGGGGNDSVLGRGGSDRLYGDAGTDTLEGGADGDYLVGGTGTGDVAKGGSGADICLAEVTQACEA